MSVHETLPEMVRRLEAELARLRRLEAAVEDGGLALDVADAEQDDAEPRGTVEAYRAALLAAAGKKVTK